MLAVIICVIATALLQQVQPQPPRILALDGRAVDPLRAEDGVRAAALVFTRTDCPVANQAAPEIERVRALFADRGVRFWLVYVDPQEPADRIEAHTREYGLRAQAILDPDHALVRRTGVRVTPEAAVYVFDGNAPRLTYRGRIDDRTIELGRQRPRVTRFDLRDALPAALDHGAPAVVATAAVGCEIADLR